MRAFFCSVKQNRNTCLFISFLLIAGLANISSRTAVPEWDTLMSCINYVIYIGLLLFWIESIRSRLIPSDARTSIISAALLMLLYMLIRIFKYRFALDSLMIRYAVYAYWIPQMLIPALFLMTCIRIRRSGRERGKQSDRLLLIPGVALSIIAITNDLHFLVYIPLDDHSQFAVITGT